MKLLRRHSARPEPAGLTIVKGAVALTLVVLFLVLGLTARQGLPGAPHYSLRAEFDDAGSLGNYADVRIAGKRVGQVVDMRAEGGKAVVEVQLDSDSGPLPADSAARIRSVSLLGARYVEISPGASTRVLEDGATIPTARTSTSVAFPQFLRTLDGSTRRGVRTTVREFGRGFFGRGSQLNTALAQMPSLLDDLHSATAAVNARAGAASRFFPSLESAAAAADPVREDIARGFEPSARALAPFEEHRRAVQELLEEAPSALPAIRAGLAQTDPLLAETEGFLAATESALGPAPAAFRQATALVREAREPLRLTRPVLAHAADTVPDVLEFTGRVRPEVADLERMLRDSVPPLHELRVHRCDFLGWASNWRSMLTFGTGGGDEQLGPLNVLRVETLGSDETLGGRGGEPEVATNPYPAPCEAGTEGRR